VHDAAGIVAAAGLLAEVIAKVSVSPPLFINAPSARFMTLFWLPVALKVHEASSLRL
jgi:hypothetical protein